MRSLVRIQLPRQYESKSHCKPAAYDGIFVIRYRFVGRLWWELVFPLWDSSLDLQEIHFIARMTIDNSLFKVQRKKRLKSLPLALLKLMTDKIVWKNQFSSRCAKILNKAFWGPRLLSSISPKKQWTERANAIATR